MIHVLSDLFQALGDAQDDAQTRGYGTQDDELRVMINVAGRWTNIKGVDWDNGQHVVLIETED